MNKYLKPLAVALVCFIAGAAVAAATSNYDRFAQFRPQLVVKGFFVGPEKGIKGVVQDTNNNITAIRVTPVDYDIPVIVPVGAQGGTFVSADIAVDAGLLANDDCRVVAKARYDGGVHPQLNFTCYVKAYNTVVMVAVNNVQDGGAHDPSDSGYEFWTTSHIPQ